jgi:long-chain acyl-CoA synthetase
VLEQRNLFTAFEGIAARMAEKPAVVAGDTVLTFRDLAARASAFAADLQANGVQHGERVAVVLPNGPEFLIAAYGIWKRGAILVPLHVLFRQQEILRYVAECDARAVVVNSRLGDLAEPLLGNAFQVEHVWICPSKGGEWQHRVRQTPRTGSAPATASDEAANDWLAVTQYSTGSTGMPKRVTRRHSHLIGEVRAVLDRVGITDADRILGAAPFFHCYGMINAALCATLSGATLFAVNDFYPKDVARLIERERITGFPGVPFMYQLLADQRETADFSSLRYALSAGAPLADSTARAFAAKYGTSVRRLYGSTETGVISIEPVGSIESEPSVGLPIAGVEVRIVDAGGQPVPAGVEGNVAVKSRYAAERYDQSDARGDSYFAGGFFHPGDRGRLDASGRLVLSGRNRGFINVAGNKVDPTEVEEVLKQFPPAVEAVVLGVPDGAAGEKIKAVLVTSSPCTPSDVLAFCATRLADFKRPRVIEFRNELPRSPLGKILRKYLLDEHDAQKRVLAFDARTGFAAPGAATPQPAGQIDWSTLPPFLRVLLVTDGTVTKNLEAFFWEPIEVDLLLHAQQSSDSDYGEIGVTRGSPIVRRRVVLRGRITGSAYAFGETIIANEALPSDMQTALVDRKVGIGELLRQRRAETFREIVSVERTTAGQWAAYLGVETSEPVAARTYTISLGGRPCVSIVEVFPESRFRNLR